MSLFQLILLLLAIAIFTIFFKQLFSGNYPKRGEDFEAKSSDESLFKSNNQNRENRSRKDELMDVAIKALDSGDNIEAKKALESLLIIDPNNLDAKRMLAIAYFNMNNYTKTKEICKEILEIDSSDDLTYSLLANAEHKLGEDENALTHHKKAIELDSTYAKHYFNYANTLYDLNRLDEAKENYKIAYNLDNSLKEAKEMLERLNNARRD